MSYRAKLLMVGLALIVSLAIGLGGGYLMGSTAVLSEDGIGSVVEAWDTITQEYVENDSIDKEAMAGAAIEAMLDSLEDPYTAYLTPEEYLQVLDNFEGQYEGIGAAVGIKDGQLTIISPFADSPAEKAGILAGDVVLEIDGNSVEGMTITEVANLTRGSAGTSVTLLVVHQGETEPVEITVVREKITAPSVNLDMMGNIAHIQITRFTDATNDELGVILESAASQGAEGIVLDLRGNPGGHLQAVLDVTSRFLSDGLVVSVVYNDGSTVDYKTTSQDFTTDLPMVVLVDGTSASGSEVLAGALKDHSRALVAGAVTFGKGSVNRLYQFSDGSGIYLTIARWLTPNGDLIEGIGVVPEIELELTGDDLLQWAIDNLNGSS